MICRAAILVTALSCQVLTAETFALDGPGLQLSFELSAGRLALTGMSRTGDRPLLAPATGDRAGNPLAVVIRRGPDKGIHRLDEFRVTKLDRTASSLTAYLMHDRMPMALALLIRVEGHVATFSGQAFWNGDVPLEADIYYPLLSGLRFESPEKDRALLAQISGSVLENLGTVNYWNPYVGSLSSPVFEVEGGGRGLAFSDDSRADFAADPGAASLHGVVIGNVFPPAELPVGKNQPKAGPDGPYAGIRYTRVFQPISKFGGEAEYNHAEKGPGPLPVRKLGDAVDLGPVRVYAYTGNWKQGAAWLRAERAHVPLRVSPAEWYRRTTFIAEDMGDTLAARGESFYDYPKVLADKQRLGADLFHIPGFHDPEILGTTYNWQNRGDYFFAAENLGGFEAARKGIDAVHRQNGHILYYVEGMIMWKRSRIGRTLGQEWALMEQDGSYTEHYKGFWHMCPAVPEWQDWLARTMAEIVRTTGVDGFFIDSTLATYNHRCFNPAHHHPHPDVWNWGVRRMLRRVREELDKVNPGAIVVVEGSGDIGRESADGFVSHSHDWTGMTFSEPLVRFLHPDMRAFESWGHGGEGKSPERLLIWNSVNGHRIYSHNDVPDRMAPLSLRTRRYYDSFPELCDNQISLADAPCKGCLTQLFDGTVQVLSVGNLTPQPSDAEISLPIPAGMLFDRVDSLRVPVRDGKASLKLQPWEFRAFEIRP